MKSKKPLIYSSLLVILFLIGGELIIPHVISFISYDSAATEYRNNYREDGWYDYTAENPEIADKKTTIIISNSQGIGREVPPNKTYIGQFSDSITKKNPDWNIENWSMGGLSTAELDLMTLRAFSREPEKIIFVLNPFNFHIPEKITLSNINSDVTLFVTDPDIRKLLDYSLLKSEFTWDFYATQYLFRYSNWLKLRKKIYRDIGLQIPHKYHPLLFGDYMQDTLNLTPDQYERIQYLKEKQFKKFLAEDYEEDRITPGLVDQKILIVKKFSENLTALQKKIKTEVILIWGPRPPKIFVEENEILYEELLNRATRTLQRHGIRVIDLTYIFPLDHFISSHFNAQGHDAFAQRLSDEIGNEFQ